MTRFIVTATVYETVEAENCQEARRVARDLLPAGAEIESVEECGDLS